MTKLLFATGNHGKVVELEKLLGDLELEVLSFRDMDTPPPEVVEDKDTFEGNARKKAAEISQFYGLPALADDSGLCVDALDGQPGVYSARYAGPEADDAANNQKLLAELAGVPAERRIARFRSVLALADVKGSLGDQVLVSDGSCEGVILDAPRGDGGFGYDPLFLVPELGQTFAELGVGTKNDRSHRAMAMRAMKPRLAAYFGL
ncbi:MAG: RdgB/HAM1 family non-canonical purine NTP pyrophosphatase [Deltaproteobacteria bacterium]|nr:RdgB/HAM1 family non-canonical purine NTP pyrophosphatase [Deltaproteobacteria bacterium]